MNEDNLNGIWEGLVDSDFELEWERYHEQIAAAEFALQILSQPAWEKEDKAVKLFSLKKDVKEWSSNGSPFSPKKWIDMKTTRTPLTDFEKKYYVAMNRCIEILNHILVVPNEYASEPPHFPPGHVELFYELGRLIMGTINYTNLSPAYRAWIGTDIYEKTTDNPVKGELQKDEKWIYILMQIVGLVGCIEEEYNSTDPSADFNPNTAEFNLTKMKAFFRTSIEEMKEKQRILQKDKTEKEVDTGVALAKHRVQVLRLMHRLSQLT